MIEICISLIWYQGQLHSVTHQYIIQTSHTCHLTFAKCMRPSRVLYWSHSWTLKTDSRSLVFFRWKYVKIYCVRLSESLSVNRTFIPLFPDAKSLIFPHAKLVLLRGELNGIQTVCSFWNTTLSWKLMQTIII